ncbi:MAG: carboxypeptidase regulatory-like domain-containing protein [Sediminibacterium sp.]|nr:carboxypeptidase regulatory-like domain-containing protein [Sediminibacterium sp.]
MFWQLFIHFVLSLIPSLLLAQHTTGNIRGTVKTGNGDLLTGASVKLVHEPTTTLYFSRTTKQGSFLLNNLNPGGPYTLEVSFAGYQVNQKKALYVTLGEELAIDVVLGTQSTLLENITVTAYQKVNRSGETVLNQDKINNQPTIGRNIYDYLRAVPQAKLSSSHEGAVSFAGQNNRYNAFYADGAVNNDVFGLSASGTNGGNAGIAPISIDAIDQFQVSISPYDVSIGNFTGGSINAITKMGSNKTEGSVYHFFSNRYLSGKLKTTENNVEQPDFATNLSGMRLQGALKKNKCFYFFNMEMQRDRYPQPFSISQYTGNTKNPNIIKILANTLRATYQYDPGNFLDNPETVNADRLVIRLDWNLGIRSKLAISNRFTLGQKTQTNTGDSKTVQFSNNGFHLLSTTNSTSIEWKTVIGNHTGNKLLITYTSVTDKRGAMGKAFPRVRINDGNGAIIFGTDNSSTNNQLFQKNLTVFDKFNFIAGSHLLNAGVDVEYNEARNVFIQNSFGNYTYSSVSNFLTNGHPSAYQLGFPLSDSLIPDQLFLPAKFSVIKAALFINDDIRPSPRFLVQFGIRADYYRFLTNPPGAAFINLVAIPAFANYWDIQGTSAGMTPAIPVSISPRAGFVYQMAEKKIIIKGGMGIFSGRIPLAWPGGIYTNNGMLVGGYKASPSQLNMIRFRADPFNQWTVAETGAVINKEPLNLMSAKFYMPTLFRTSLTIEKKFTHGWSVMLEGMLSKNIHEIAYTNINLLPATDRLPGPDYRSVYTIVNNGRIPLNPDGSNPYDYAILLGNNNNEKGYSKTMTATITKKNISKWNWEIHYTTGKSMAMNDGTASVNASQWRFMESVNGRNFLTRSVSDFSTGHKIFAQAGKKFRQSNKKKWVTITLNYNGQSGSPFSYVYGEGSLTRDDGILGSYDLLYIPTEKELTEMVFLENIVNGITYSTNQQKKALELFIKNDPYLNKRRGNYAERNGSRTPFTHKVDLTIKQDLTIRLRNRFYLLQVSLDICNLLNLINTGWGLQYNLPFDQYPLIGFAGYTGVNNYLPVYRFNPILLQKSHLTLSNSTVPAYASNWSSQIGFRLSFTE